MDGRSNRYAKAGFNPKFFMSIYQNSDNASIAISSMGSNGKRRNSLPNDSLASRELVFLDFPPLYFPFFDFFHELEYSSYKCR